MLNEVKLIRDEARKDFTAERFRAAILNLYTCLELAIKNKISTKIIYLSEGIEQLEKISLISENLAEKLRSFIRLRNKITHGAYIPKQKEVKDSFQVAEKLLETLNLKF